jgi:hypothetical protein
MAAQDQISLERQSDIDIGYDYIFERRWARFERIVWGLFTLLIAAGLAGIFGRGPMNQVKRTLGDGSRVQYERIVRFKSPTRVNFELPANQGVAQIEADLSTITKLGLQQVFPQPTRDWGSEQVGPLQFQSVTSGTNSVFVQLAMQPAALGFVTSTYIVNGRTTVRIRQLVLP